MHGCEEQISSAILAELSRHQRLAKNSSCAARPCQKCASVHVGRITGFVHRREPILLVLPAFPGKSPNRRKVMGVLPDLAERLSLSFLQSICDSIQQMYPPGARLVICSDGHVFSDVVRMSDDNVTRYQAALRAMVAEQGASRIISLFDLGNRYREHSHSDMRQALVAEYAEDLPELKQRVRAEHDLLSLYRGLTRFLVEDADQRENFGSRSALQRDCRQRAYELLQRSRAWGRLVAETFPAAIRLSIHPQPCGSQKLGVNLLPATDNWTTPWHSVAVDVGGRYVLMRRHEAESIGARPVRVGGRPSHYALDLDGSGIGPSFARPAPGHSAEPLGDRTAIPQLPGPYESVS